jgi:hypothetical protein
MGVQARIKKLTNPDHKAFLRLFGGSEVDATKKVSLRPCKDVIEKILWDPALSVEDFSFGYSDRYYEPYQA